MEAGAAQPLVNRVKKSEPNHFVSDCPMAAVQVAEGLEGTDAGNPLSLLRHAYGI